MANVEKQVISIEATIWERKGIERVERGKEWDLWLNGKTTLQDIEDFYEVAEDIFKWCIKAQKNGITYQLQLHHCVYYDDSTSRCDSWVSVPWYDQDGENIFLRANERNEDPQRDLYLTKNIRKDIASYVI